MPGPFGTPQPPSQSQTWSPLGAGSFTSRPSTYSRSTPKAPYAASPPSNSLLGIRPSPSQGQAGSSPSRILGTPQAPSQSQSWSPLGAGQLGGNRPPPFAGSAAQIFGSQQLAEAWIRQMMMGQQPGGGQWGGFEPNGGLMGAQHQQGPASLGYGGSPGGAVGPVMPIFGGPNNGQPGAMGPMPQLMGPMTPEQYKKSLL